MKQLDDQEINPTSTTTDANLLSNPPDDEDPDIIKIRQQYRRFRVLIMGKANAGKTTILQKICDTTEQPIVRDQDGNVVSPSSLQSCIDHRNHAEQRGHHHIEYEVTFASNPGFVFHDSRGFEAGSMGEIQAVHDFIESRGKSGNVIKQLHIIWYCIPVDGARVLSPAEAAFFNCGTGNVVPVIAVFTKWDGLVLKVCNELRNQGMRIREARQMAPALALQEFEEHYLSVINSVSFPPTEYEYLSDMHKVDATCIRLSEKTAKALKSSSDLQKLFVSIQSNNVQLAMKYGIE
ncbi:hypothetical protein JAAARDRAFT_134250 [Jaapia argillacea MUCL 33604]|uniref:G domain-containing protein n=1 Tax=Jaapia argillacea MUCL 33604 TaxID=933084 RepID=A0A067PXZ5_9AGAM|nr:hypothetical protein JAAARDRAFT_134250 [Jaapia argillacea MUCL 33604]